MPVLATDSIPSFRHHLRFILRLNKGKEKVEKKKKRKERKDISIALLFWIALFLCCNVEVIESWSMELFLSNRTCSTPQRFSWFSQQL